MQRRDAIKAMGVGAVALATGSVPTSPQEPPNKKRLIPIDKDRQWEIIYPENLTFMWSPGGPPVLHVSDNEETIKYIASSSHLTELFRTKNRFNDLFLVQRENQSYYITRFRRLEEWPHSYSIRIVPT